MTYALDTNTLIYFFKNLGGVADQLFAVAPSQVAVPAVVLYELEIGIALSTSPERRRRQLRALLQHTKVLPFDESAAAKSARIGSDLKKAGRPIGPLDTLIAGTAIAADAILVTHNMREFQRVPGLKTTDWF